MGGDVREGGCLRAGRHVDGGIPYGYRTRGRGELEPDRPDIAEPAKLPASASTAERRAHRAARQEYRDAHRKAPAGIVERIFAEAADGYSPGRIAKGLNADGVSPPGARVDDSETARPRLWSRQTVRNIIENRVYLGERYGVRGKGDRRIPPLVSAQLWNAANEALRARARPKGDS